MGGRHLGDPQRRFDHGVVEGLAGCGNEDALDHGALGGFRDDLARSRVSAR
jgi:hypothetical protein